MKIIIFSLIYLLSFIVFIFTTINPNYQKYRVFTKSLTSILFVLLYIVLDASLKSMILALSFCLLGDILLGITKNNKKIFMVQGIIAFLLAHIIYIYLMIQDQSFKLFDLSLPILGLIFVYYISKKLDMNFKNKTLAIYLYTFIVFLMGSKALNVLWYSTYSGARFFAIGGILFLISDIILLFLYFKYYKNMKLQISNSILYYLAQYLMVISFII